MPEHTPSTQGGFIKYVIIFIVLAAILAYFGITAADMASWPPVVAIGGWLSWFWHTVVIGFVWNGFAHFFGIHSSATASSTAATTTLYQSTTHST